MCHGHPHFHTCSHTSVKWLYCPEAAFDLNTGYETPCSNTIYSTPQPSNADCPLQNCHFKSFRGSWTCCMCGNGSNTQGWCSGSRDVDGTNSWTAMGLEPSSYMTCGHGACHKCSRNSSSRGSSPEISFLDMRKGKSRPKLRNSNKRCSKYDYTASFPTVHEEDEHSGSSGSSKGSRASPFDVGLEYSSKKSKPVSKKKGQRRTHH